MWSFVTMGCVCRHQQADDRDDGVLSAAAPAAVVPIVEQFFFDRTPMERRFV
jgi:hypothetical protein